MSSTFDSGRMERVVEIFRESLFDDCGERVRQYLTEERGWDVERLRSFEVGYCPPEIPYPVRGRDYVDGRLCYMRGRLIVPIRDEFGRIVALAGRKLDWCHGPLQTALLQEFGAERGEHLMEKWLAGKWINESYKKKHHLYRLFDCRRLLPQLGHAIVVEGYLDAIALADAGFPNTICLSGTSMTIWHMQALRRYGVSHLVLCLDSDVSGINAAWRSNEASGEEEAASTCQILLPEGLDPDETIAHPLHGPTLRWALAAAATRTDERSRRKPILIDSFATRLAAKRGLTNNTHDASLEVEPE